MKKKKNIFVQKSAAQILEARRKKEAMEKLYKIQRQKNKLLEEEILGHIEKERIMEAIIILLLREKGKARLRREDISAALKKSVRWRFGEKYIEAVADSDRD